MSEMAFKVLLIAFCCCVSSLLAIPVGEEDPFFRNDYTYVPSIKMFFKEHKTLTKWADAVAKCSGEGATLLVPKSEVEAQAALSFRDNNTHYLWLGVHDMFSEGEFTTLDGKFLSDIFIKWQPNEPSNSDDKEHCVTIGADGLSNDIACDRRFNYICSKESTNITKNPVCETYDTEYAYFLEADRCYKLHTVPRNWNDAFRICKAEQSQLAIVNSEEEAKIFVDMIAKYPVDTLSGNFDKGLIFLGFSDLISSGLFLSLNGKTLQDEGYNIWGGGQPDNFQNNERCGSMFRDGKLNDFNCAIRAMFVCEKTLGDPTTVLLHSRFGDVNTKPS